MSAGEYTVSRYPHGCFSWVDLSCQDADAAAEFYGGLMGWESHGMDAGYDMKYLTFHKDGHVVAGLAEVPAEMGDFPARWHSYVTVQDVAALMEPIEAAGGSIIQPIFEVPDGGKIALIQDPDGAALGLMQPAEFIGATLVNTPGALCWNDVYTRDAALTRGFYERIFGWECQEDVQGYYRFTNQGRNNGGMLPMDEEMQEAYSPWWMVYFSVPDIDQAAERVVELGGQLDFPPQPADAGRFFVFRDPQGAPCSLFQLNEAERWEG